MVALMASLWTSPVSDDQAAAFLRQNPNQEQTSLTNPFAATAQTIRYMARLVRHSLSDPVVFSATDEALRVLAIAGSPCAAIWHWCKRSIEFVHHQELLKKWLGKGDSLQLLISPEALLKMQNPKGDCAVFTTLICAMLQTAGIRWEIVIVACDRSQPGIFSHVFPRAVLGTGAGFRWTLRTASTQAGKCRGNIAGLTLWAAGRVLKCGIRTGNR